MKIAFCMSEHFFTTGGGGRIQILKTKEYLEKLYKDVSISIIHEADNINSDFDIVHIFNLADLDLNMTFIKAAKNVNAKIYLSTIYWDYKYLILTGMFSKIFGYDYNTLIFNIENSLGKIISFFMGRPEYLNPKTKNKYIEILNKVDYLLPNSTEEGEKLLEYCNLNSSSYKNKIIPIVNAVENVVSADKFDLNLKNYVLEVGRIEPAKNQLKLVLALRDKKLPIVFLGHDYFPNSKYSKKLHKIAKKRGNVFFFDQVPYNQVHSFYENASVHILPSLRESPGLVSLEALLNGCKIVVCNDKFTPVNSYFKDIATIINPLSKKAIKNGINAEINKQRDFDKIKENIINKFTWNNTAIETYEAYLRK